MKSVSEISFETERKITELLINELRDLCSEIKIHKVLVLAWEIIQLDIQED